jgi:hypothetical protein
MALLFGIVKSAQDAHIENPFNLEGALRILTVLQQLTPWPCSSMPFL